MFARLALTLLAINAAYAQISPNTPVTSTQGGDCTIDWVVDTSATASDWSTTNIQLMTGADLAMVHITTVGTVDGSDATQNSFTYPCPEVSINSAIYFYQFTNPITRGAGAAWTTRFGMGDATGALTPPTESIQPTTNSPIPWGRGALANPAIAVAPPAYLATGAVAPVASAVSLSSVSASATSTVTATPEVVAPVVPIVAPAATTEAPQAQGLPNSGPTVNAPGATAMVGGTAAAAVAAASSKAEETGTSVLNAGLAAGASHASASVVALAAVVGLAALL